ncbi:ABC transporter ATP-binding protein [Streptomyces sp. NRRL B-3229]|uniref:ABC transporter ATP-binding protein n=1 Tax=Streptomyces sp. NRRL B-3229 TaxID=1463836 RepID=UPI0004BEB4D2|nr:ABC transporter ATP-binding protein [Streptomyces sp. NRRL B-3229]
MTATASPPVLDLQGVSKAYPGPPPVTALHPTHLRVETGDFLAVVGPSGSGKSTLLNLMGLLDRPTHGTYRLSGTDVATLTERDRAALRGRRVGFVFQAFHLLPHRTALENVALARLYVTARGEHRQADAARALGRVGLGHRLDALPGRLSGGERQRVAIARAVVSAPDILLCDEPTGNLDSVTAGTVMDLLAELNQAGVTIVVITHDPAVAQRARRQVTMLDGRLSEPAPGGRSAGGRQ